MQFYVRGLAAVCLAFAAAQAALGYSGARVYFNDAIRMPSVGRGQTITRRTLTAAERSAAIPFSISLKMRNTADLQSRIEQGQRIDQAEMEANYLPPLDDFQAMQAWLVSEGFTLGTQDPNHTIVFASGTVSRIEAAFGVTFARVTTADGEFTSAISAPSLPVELAGSALSIDGFQPHIRLHQREFVSDSVAIPNSSVNVTAPSDILAQYNAPANFNGAGQTIAIIGPGTCSASDYNSYCSTIGLNQTAANFLSTINVTVPLETNTNNPGSEVTLDVETASGMAPGAKIRLYNTPTSTFLDAQAACVQILADAKANNITVVSMSEATPENTAPVSSLQAASQQFSLLAAAGITILAGSGDGGSNPNTNGTLGYNANNPLTAEYPATDPFVTGVGGTMMTIAPSTFNRVSESGSWDVPGGTPFGNGASGGGISTVFQRPSWQTDGGSILTTSSKRCVPDVAAVQEDIIPGVADTGGLVVFNGVASFVGGTSVSAPLWAGLIADFNHSRATLSLPSIGLLGPAIYPLHATGFTDISTGSNGAYSAGAGYDLVTGLGVPNLTALNTGLLAYNVIAPPAITSQPQPVTVNVGSSFSLSVTATGSGTLSYQWFLGSSAIRGATSSTCSVASAGNSDAGSYTVTVSNSSGSVTSSAAAVTVSTPVPAPTPTPAPSSGGGGGGGGGAMSLWSYLILAIAVSIRLLQRKFLPVKRSAGFTIAR